MKQRLLLLSALILSLNSYPDCSASIVDISPYQSFFEAKHDKSFLSKLFMNKRTHSELIITQKLRKTLIDEINSEIETEIEALKEKYGDGTEEFEDAVYDEKYDSVISPDWDHPTNYVKVIIFKTPSSYFSSGKDLKPIKYGLADSDDKLICEAENAGTYEFNDEDLKYLKRVYGIKVDKKNRNAFISYYQPLCLIEEAAKKRLIAFEDKGETKVTVLKYNRDFYNSLIRKDYKWVDEPETEL